MKNKYAISITLDKRRVRADRTYPVRLRMFDRETRTQKLYPTEFHFTPKDFESIWETAKPRVEYKEVRKQMQMLEMKANEVADGLPEFSFSEFERVFYGKTDMKLNVNYYYGKLIEKHQKRESIATALTYQDSLRCFLLFHGKPNLDFRDITVSFLERFEKHCIEVDNKSISTVSFYMRPLKAVFNEAIADKVISQEIYPFGVRKYQIKASRARKRALSKAQVKLLFEGTPLSSLQEKAKAFWFFSYLCNGMNIKDIVSLKGRNLSFEKIEFIRAKTATTSKTPKRITVYLNDYSRDIIRKYGSFDVAPNEYVFPLLNSKQSAREQYKLKNKFIHFVNRHFSKYAASLGINLRPTSYFARHTFATIVVKEKGVEFVSEAFGHTDIKTTMIYFGGFDNEEKKSVNDILMNF